MVQTATTPHVCFVALTAYPVLAGRRDLTELGGAQVQQTIVAKALVRAGVKVTFICIDYGQEDDIEIDGIRVLKTFAPEEGLRGLRFFHPRITRLWSAMEKANADIYYQRCSGMTTGVVAAFCKAKNKPFIFSGAHDLDFSPGPSPEILPGKRDRAIYRWGLRHTAAIIAQNERQIELVRQNYGQSSVLIPSCHDDAGIVQRAAAEGGEILWVGMIRPIKRPELFIEIARRLPHLRFRMVGGAMGNTPEILAYYESIRADAEALPNLQFMGFVPYAEVGAYFDRAAVLLSTSEFEGFPNIFLQAWARRVPAVAYFDTGSRLEDEPVYPVIGSVDEAVNCLDSLTRETALYDRVASRCLAYFEAHHAPRVTVARYRALFDSLVAKPRAA